MKAKPEIGDVMWRVYFGRYRQKQESVIVTRVGRKYVAVQGEGEHPIETEHGIEGGRQRGDHGSYVLYASEQEWLDAVEEDRLAGELQSFFRAYNLPLNLEQLRKIRDIIKPTT